MKRFDDETDDDLAPWIGACARGYCDEPNTAKVLDPELCTAMAIHVLREHRDQNRILREISASDHVGGLYDQLEHAWTLLVNAWYFVQREPGQTSEAWIAGAEKWREKHHKGIPPADEI